MPKKKKKTTKRHSDLDELQEKLGYKFDDPGLLDLALTHRSHGYAT